MNYSKPPLSVHEQIALLSSRQMVISDVPTTIRKFSHINYYRLSAYWQPFRKLDATGNLLEQFASGANFDDAIKIYEFDRKLRRLVLEAVEHVEVSIRANITRILAERYGSFAHVSPENFHVSFDHADWMFKLEQVTLNSREQFIKHYRNKYANYPTLPIWIAIELISMGSLSKLYNGLKNDDKRQVARVYDIHHKTLQRWFHVLTYIRNICAHHGRLWNKELAIRPKTIEFENVPNDRIFIVLLMLHQLLLSCHGHKPYLWWRECSELIDLFAHQSPNLLNAMGICNETYKRQTVTA